MGQLFPQTILDLVYVKDHVNNLDLKTILGILTEYTYVPGSDLPDKSCGFSYEYTNSDKIEGAYKTNHAELKVDGNYLLEDVPSSATTAFSTTYYAKPGTSIIANITSGSTDTKFSLDASEFNEASVTVELTEGSTTKKASKSFSAEIKTIQSKDFTTDIESTGQLNSYVDKAFNVKLIPETTCKISYNAKYDNASYTYQRRKDIKATHILTSDHTPYIVSEGDTENVQTSVPINSISASINISPAFPILLLECKGFKPNESTPIGGTTVYFKDKNYWKVGKIENNTVSSTLNAIDDMSFYFNGESKDTTKYYFFGQKSDTGLTATFKTTPNYSPINTSKILSSTRKSVQLLALNQSIFILAYPKCKAVSSKVNGQTWGDITEINNSTIFNDPNISVKQGTSPTVTSDYAKAKAADGSTVWDDSVYVLYYETSEKKYYLKYRVIGIQAGDVALSLEDGEILYINF